MNPLMNAMGGRPTSGNGNIAMLIQMLRSGNPQQIGQNMMQNNPQFRQFIESNKGKTPEQVAREHGIDLPGFIR